MKLLKTRGGLLVCLLSLTVFWPSPLKLLANGEENLQEAAKTAAKGREQVEGGFLSASRQRKTMQQCRVPVKTKKEKEIEVLKEAFGNSIEDPDRSDGKLGEEIAEFLYFTQEDEVRQELRKYLREKHSDFWKRAVLPHFKGFNTATRLMENEEKTQNLSREKLLEYSSEKIKGDAQLLAGKIESNLDSIEASDQLRQKAKELKADIEQTVETEFKENAKTPAHLHSRAKKLKKFR